MTIEIKQLVIRAVVDATRAPGRRSESIGSVAPPPVNSSPVTQLDAQIDLEALRTVCVNEIRRELRRLRER